MKLIRRLRTLFARRRLEREMAEEMRQHLECRAEANEREGLGPEEARYAAQRKFGNMSLLQERVREQREGFVARQLAVCLQDLRFGVRMLARKPGITLVAVATLALGLGANAAIYAIMRGVQRPPVEVRDPETFVQLYRFNPGRESYHGAFSYPEYATIRDNLRSLSALVATGPVTALEFEPDSTHPDWIFTESALVQPVSAGFFPALEARFSHGRGFLPEEDAVPGRDPVIVLSHEFWERNLQSDPNVLGQLLTFGRQRYMVVGVASFVPRLGTLSRGRAVAGWVPLMMERQLLGSPASQSERVYSTGAARGAAQSDLTLFQEDRRRDRLDSYTQTWLAVQARLAPGATREQARQELQGVLDAIARDHPELRRTGAAAANQAALVPANAMPRSAQGGWIVFVGPAILLLIACANVGNLLMARASTRRHELAVRRSLGAGRFRIVRQLLTESLLLGLLGGLVALGVAVGLARAIVAVISESGISLSSSPQLDLSLLGFVLALAVAVTVVFGLVPATWAAGLGLTDALKKGGAHYLGGASLNQRQFAALQMALSVVLLLVSVTIARVLYQGGRSPIEAGDRIAVLDPNLMTHGYSSVKVDDLFETLRERLAAMPGVSAVGVTDSSPERASASSSAMVGSESDRTARQPVTLRWARVAPEYFGAIGAPIVRGRNFAPDDQGQRVVIVSAAAAQAFWPGEDPIGRTLYGNTGFDQKVIGVVENGFHPELFPDQAHAYQVMWPRLSANFGDHLLVVRFQGESGSVTAELLREVRALDPQVRPKVRLVAQIEEEKAARVRPWALLAGGLAGTALLLAAVGLHGVMSFAVTHRTSEIGVRIALGSTPGEATRLILRQGFRLVAWGAVFGTGIGIAVIVFLRSQAVGIKLAGPGTFAGVLLLLGAVAALACWLPARRAAKVDPMIALRSE